MCAVSTVHPYVRAYAMPALLRASNVSSWDDLTNLVTDCLRVNKLVFKTDSWVASAMLRRVELWDDDLVIPPALPPAQPCLRSATSWAQCAVGLLHRAS